MGMSRVASSDLSWRQASNPLSLGIIPSIKIKSGLGDPGLSIVGRLDGAADRLKPGLEQRHNVSFIIDHQYGGLHLLVIEHCNVFFAGLTFHLGVLRGAKGLAFLK